MIHRGQILLLSLVFLAVFLSLVAALMAYVLQYSTSGRYLLAQRQALYLAEAGVDKAAYGLNQNPGYSGEANTPLGAGVFTVTVANQGLNQKRVTSTACVPNCTTPLARRTVQVTMAINTSQVAFRFGVQIGDGGLVMNNNSRVIGNVYTNGNITGDQATITGDATAGGTSSISGVTVGGTAWANALSDCTVGGDALYMSITGCAVAGELHPGSMNAATGSMPISDEQIDEWEEIAEAGGVISGNYTATGTQQLGPRKIDGDLTVNGTLYLTGPVWVEGNVTFANNSGLHVHSSLGSSGAIVVADNPGSESSSGTVYLSNNMTVSGNGSTGSYPMLLSTNSSGNAISLNNNASGVILYAANGTIQVSNNGGANQITAYRLHLNNNAEIEYVMGLQSQSFSNGPGGSWAFVPGTYGLTN